MASNASQHLIREIHKPLKRDPSSPSQIGRPVLPDDPNDPSGSSAIPALVFSRSGDNQNELVKTDPAVTVYECYRFIRVSFDLLVDHLVDVQGSVVRASQPGDERSKLNWSKEIEAWTHEQPKETIEAKTDLEKGQMWKVENLKLFHENQLEHWQQLILNLEKPLRKLSSEQRTSKSQNGRDQLDILTQTLIIILLANALLTKQLDSTANLMPDGRPRSSSQGSQSRRQTTPSAGRLAYSKETAIIGGLGLKWMPGKESLIRSFLKVKITHEEVMRLLVLREKNTLYFAWIKKFKEHIIDLVERHRAEPEKFSETISETYARNLTPLSRSSLEDIYRLSGDAVKHPSTIFDLDEVPVRPSDALDDRTRALSADHSVKSQGAAEDEDSLYALSVRSAHSGGSHVSAAARTDRHAMNKRRVSSTHSSVATRIKAPHPRGSDSRAVERDNNQEKASRDRDDSISHSGGSHAEVSGQGYNPPVVGHRQLPAPTASLTKASSDRENSDHKLRKTHSFHFGTDQSHSHTHLIHRRASDSNLHRDSSQGPHSDKGKDKEGPRHTRTTIMAAHGQVSLGASRSSQVRPSTSNPNEDTRHGMTRRTSRYKQGEGSSAGRQSLPPKSTTPPSTSRHAQGIDPISLAQALPSDVREEYDKYTQAALIADQPLRRGDEMRAEPQGPPSEADSSSPFCNEYWLQFRDLVSRRGRYQHNGHTRSRRQSETHDNHANGSHPNGHESGI